jgi:hypothetical protein
MLVIQAEVKVARGHAGSPPKGTFKASPALLCALDWLKKYLQTY